MTEHLEAQGLSQKRFAELLGKRQGNVSLILTGRRTPPLPKMPHWADVLKLTVANRKKLIELAGLEATPEVIRDLVVHLRAEVHRLKKSAGLHG